MESIVGGFEDFDTGTERQFTPPWCCLEITASYKTTPPSLATKSAVQLHRPVSSFLESLSRSKNGEAVKPCCIRNYILTLQDSLNALNLNEIHRFQSMSDQHMDSLLFLGKRLLVVHQSVSAEEIPHEIALQRKNSLPLPRFQIVT